jgi:hypothetical protein
MDITTTPEWAALQAVPRPAHLRELFAADPERAARYTTVVGDLRVDWSKNLIDDAVVSAMLDVVRASAFHDRRAAMFRGEPINATERRAVLHTALRAPARDARRGRRPRRRPRGARRARPDGRVRRSGAVGCSWLGCHGSAHPHRRQHRHRGQRPRPGDGVPRHPRVRAARSHAAGS